MEAVPLRERKKQFHELIKRHMAGLGFAKSGESYFLKLTPETTGILSAFGIGRPGPDGSILEIFASAAVRFEPLEELQIELGRSTKNNRLAWHINTHIGYLMPERTYTPWLFGPGEDMTQGALEFVDCIRRYVLPYMRSYASPQALATEILSIAARHTDMKYKYEAASLLYLLGRHDEALAMLHEIREKHPGDELSRKFTECLSAKIEVARQAQR